jgi:septal ring factor EnvC (AmiA/AmiB activator)
MTDLTTRLAAVGALTEEMARLLEHVASTRYYLGHDSSLSAQCEPAIRSLVAIIERQAKEGTRLEGEVADLRAEVERLTNDLTAVENEEAALRKEIYELQWRMEGLEK